MENWHAHSLCKSWRGPGGIEEKFRAMLQRVRKLQGRGSRTSNERLDKLRH